MVKHQKPQNLAAKLRKLAEAMQPQIEAKLHPATANQNWTRRRANIMDGMYRDAQHLQRIQRALCRLADCYERDQVPSCLAGVTSRKTLELLLTWREWPRSEWAEDVRRSLLSGGITIESFAEARAAAEELAGEDDLSELKQRRLADKIRGKVGVIPGFYPTPPDVVDRMLQELIGDVSLVEHEGLTLQFLEPSAGSGAIVERILKVWPQAQVDCLEINYDLREYLEARGYCLVGDDFLCWMPPNGGYRFIVQNPPFENHADVAHIRHAYDCLALGGVLVSVVSESPFFRQDKTSEEFRAWLQGLEANEVDLPPNAFEKSGTGVKARFVVIRKPAAEEDSLALPKSPLVAPVLTAAPSSQLAAGESGSTRQWEQLALF
jgi:hypothetical protein